MFDEKHRQNILPEKLYENDLCRKNWKGTISFDELFLGNLKLMLS